MADCNYAMEGWEWESIFTSSLLEQDITWHDELSEPRQMVAGATDLSTIIHPPSSPSLGFPGTFANPELLCISRPEGDSESTRMAAVIATNTSDGSLDSSGYNHDTPGSSHHLSSETSLIKPPTPSITKKKKRDPRLECPNFLAGRIPCSCPEEDELDEDAEGEALMKKRSKLAARCQVPSCGDDISHLKGYHQRHRVCLRCANSPKVMLKDQAHRYCQQCGKFHRLSDFDEGKRSCRRKLERHNRRRRRRPVDEEEEALNGEVPLQGNDIDCSKVQTSPEETGAASTKQGIHTQVASAELRKEGSPTKEERIPEAALIDENFGSCLVDILQNREVGAVTQDLMNSIIDDQRTSDDMSASIPRFDREIVSSIESKSDEHLLVSMLMGNANDGVDQVTENPKHVHGLKSEATRASCNNQRKRIEYVTSRPAGRISFKLYDWNPADFPRRLRQQIFEWLASMPVELESYVRSGCIILTFFVTMPQVMWDKVLFDWRGHVQKLICNSGMELLGTGQLMTQMVEKSICFKDGKLSRAYCKEPLAPFLVDLYPCSVEAGCSTQIYVSGFNFAGARFLVSFGEQYVECSDWELVDNHHFIHSNVWNGLSNLEIQKLTVLLPDSKEFGLAYVEVETVHGVSNFMPVLVADKDVCLEINAFRENCALPMAAIKASHEKLEASRPQYPMDIITDLGWSLKYMNKGLIVDKAEVREALMNRLQSLLIFSLENCCHAVMQRLVQMTFTTIGNPIIHCIVDTSEGTWNASYASKAIKYIQAEGGSFASKKSTMLPKISGCQAVERPNQMKGLQMPKVAAEQLRSAPTSTRLEELDSSSFWSSKGLTAMEVPLVEERIPILEYRWRRKGCWISALGWSRKPMGTSSICVSNRKFYGVLVAAVGIVMVCAGMCFMPEYPHEVVEISMSLRRCLWSSSTEVQHA